MDREEKLNPADHTTMHIPGTDELGERSRRIAELRREIAAGSYETAERLETAVERLWRRLVVDGEPRDEVR